MIAAAKSVTGLAASVRLCGFGEVTLHTYIAPEDGLLVNTQIVEGPTRLIIFDAQYFLPHAAEAATYAKSLGKPVERIILSHVHLDHWSGLEAFLRQFPEAPVYGPRGLADYLRDNGQRILNARRPVLGERIPAHPTIPNRTLTEGFEVIDGIPFEFRRYLDAASALQLVTLLPAQRTLLAFDLAFAPDQHVFTVTPHFDNWIAIMRELGALPEYDLVLSGHGGPTDRLAIDATIRYLEKGKAVYAGSKDASEYARRMKRAFPDRNHPGWIDIAASLLYNVVDAYVTDR